MEQRDLDSTYDPMQPWHIMIEREGVWHIHSTYATAVEVIQVVGAMPQPERIIVRHMPTDNDGTGSAFLREVNRRMRHAE